MQQIEHIYRLDINDNLLKLSLVTLEFSSRMLTCYFICLLGKEAFKMVGSIANGGNNKGT